jgi:hypothetical protein
MRDKPPELAVIVNVNNCQAWWRRCSAFLLSMVSNFLLVPKTKKIYSVRSIQIMVEIKGVYEGRKGSMQSCYYITAFW